MRKLVVLALGEGECPRASATRQGDASGAPRSKPDIRGDESEEANDVS